MTTFACGATVGEGAIVGKGVAAGGGLVGRATGSVVVCAGTLVAFVFGGDVACATLVAVVVVVPVLGDAQADAGITVRSSAAAMLWRRDIGGPFLSTIAQRR